ncbi:MAG: WD40 repeat domain-containing protein [Planctomycetota bacterium]|nr:WD40 repeat domain-containing protein [Planctomycetota bacterium]
MRVSILGLAVMAVLPALLVPACHDSSSWRNLIGPQTGSLSVSIATGKVNVVTQPQALTLSGTAVLDSPASTLTVSLLLQNISNQIVFNPKILVTNLNEGTVTGDGTFGGGGGDPYVYYGPKSMRSGASVTRDIVIDGVSGTIPDITLDVEIVFHPMFFVSSDYDVLMAVDSSGTNQTFLIDGLPLGYQGDNFFDMVFLDGVASPDGRFIYMGSRNQPALTILDTTTLLPVMGKDLTGNGNIAFDSTGTIGSVDAVTMSPDAKHLYAVLNEGAHAVRFSGTYNTPEVSVVKIRRSDLSVVGRLTLLDPGAPFIEHRGHKASLSADGSLGVVAVTEQGLVFLFDAVSMTLLQTFDVSTTSTELRLAALAPDGSTIYAAYIDNDGTLDVIDVATGGVSTLALPTPETSLNWVGALTFGPDGRLYYTRVTQSPGLSIYDPVSMTWVEQTVVGACYGVAFSADGTTYYANDYDNSEIHAFDIATDAIIPNEADGGPTIPHSNWVWGHCFIVTPL